MEFKVIIAGGRDFNNYELLKAKCDYYLSNLDEADVVIVSGAARGADKLGEQYAKERGYKIDSDYYASSEPEQQWDDVPL